MRKADFSHQIITPIHLKLGKPSQSGVESGSLPRTREPAVVHGDVLPLRDGAQVRAGAEDARGARADHADAELLTRHTSLAS